MIRIDHVIKAGITDHVNGRDHEGTKEKLFKFEADDQFDGNGDRDDDDGKLNGHANPSGQSH